MHILKSVSAVHDITNAGLLSRRSRLLVYSSATALMLLGSAPALAAPNACGVAVTGEVTCTSTGNPYPTGIEYTTSGPLTVNLVAGVQVNSGQFGGVNIITTGSASGRINAAAGSSITTTNVGLNVNGSGSTGAGIIDNAATIQAGFIGLAMQTGGNATINNSGALTITQFSNFGIFAFSSAGNVAINNSGTITTQGVGVSFGINTFTQGAAAQTQITNSGAINITRALGVTPGTGIDATASGANSVVNITNSAPITVAQASRGVGISTVVNGNTSITSSGPVTVTGRRATGINASTDSANGTITVAATGAITANSSDAGMPNDAAGILAVANNGAVNINAGTVQTTGPNMPGISATTTGGAINVTGQNILVSGRGGAAILARSTGGAVTVTSGTARAIDQNAVNASSTNGPVTVNVTGANTSAEVAAVNVQAGTTATVAIASTGSVQGATSGIVVAAPTSIAVTNAGTITGGSGFAIDAAGGPAAVTNSGTITGALRLTGSNDSFSNSGTFNAIGVSQFGAGNDIVTNSGTIFANSDMDFGAGTDTFNNSGILQVLLSRPAATTVTLVGLEAFNNSGLVDLRNGRTGDVLNIPGTFTGTGNSRLGLDVNFGATNSADRLVVGGAATGSTALDLTITGSPQFGTGPVLVQGGAGTSASAFVLPSRQVGLVQLELAFANNAFTLVGTPSDSAFRSSAFLGAVRNLWHESADAWSAQMREGRDTAAGGNAGEPGARFWFQGYGRLSERDQGDDFTAFGSTRNVDLSYDQDFFGGQMGLDFGGGVGEQGGFAFGVTGGYVDSHVNFQGVGDDLEMRAVNVGAYGRLSTGLFFVNALAKYDHILDVSARSQSAGFDVGLDGNLYGGSLEAGLRLGDQRFYVEPVASISYVHADLDGFSVAGTNLAFEAENGLRGAAGARIGSTFAISERTTGNVYAGAQYVHDFRGSDEVVLTNGPGTLRVAALEERDFVKVVAGLNVGAGKVSGFFEGNGEFLNDRSGFGLRAGMRMRF